MPEHLEQQARALTFDDLAGMEPLLAKLRAEIARVKDDGSRDYFCANQVWFSAFKPVMVLLVGYHARRRVEQPLLGTAAAYDIAYRDLYDALPFCRHDGIFCV